MCKICDDFINSTYEECLTHTELREAMEKFLLVSGFSNEHLRTALVKAYKREMNKGYGI